MIATIQQTDDTITFQDMSGGPNDYITTDMWADLEEAR